MGNGVDGGSRRLGMVAELWARQGITARQIGGVSGHDILSASPCTHCRQVLLGTREGLILCVSAKGAEVERVPGFRSGCEIRSLAGCPSCSAGGLLVGDASGRTWAVHDKREQALVFESVHAVVFIRIGDSGRLALACDAAGRASPLVLHQDQWRLGSEPVALPWLPSWVQRPPADDPLSDFGLLSVGADGRVCRLMVEPDGVEIIDVDPLPWAPESANVSRDGRSVVVFDGEVVGLARWEGDAWEWKPLTHKRNVAFVAISDLFGVECVTYGELYSGAITLRQGRDLPSIRWPATQGGAFGLWIAPHPPSSSTARAFAVLSDGSFYGFEIDNPRELATILAEFEPDAFDEAEDVERHALLTTHTQSISPLRAARLVERGGRHTCRGGVHWLTHYGEVVQARTFVRISASILAASRAQGRASVRRFALRLHQETVLRSRAATGDEHLCLANWTRFLKRHFLTWKRRVHRPQVRDAFDQLMTEARRRRNRHRALWETATPEIRSMCVHRFGDGGGRLVASLADGGLRGWTIEASGACEAIPALSWNPTSSGHSSRVLLQLMDYEELKVFAAPRIPIEHEGVIGPPFLPGDDNASAIYSIVRVRPGTFMLGTRCPERPILLWHQNRRQVESLQWTRMDAGRSATGECRIHVLLQLPGYLRDWYVLGGEDGSLTIAALRRLELDAASARTIPIGSVVTCAETLCLDDTVYVAFGTQGGTLTVGVVDFPDGRPHEAPEIGVKFRAVFPDPVAAILVDEDEALFVLTSRGDLTRFSLSRGNGTSFLGQRGVTTRVAQDPTAVVALGGNRIMVASREDGDAHTLRLVELDASATKGASDLEAACALLEEGGVREPLDLLAALPTRTALDSLLVEPRLRADPTIPVVESLLAEALEKGASVELLVATLEAIVDVMLDTSSGEATPVAGAVLEVLVGDNGYLWAGRNLSAARQSAAMRVLVRPEVCRAWASATLGAPRFQKWLRRYLLSRHRGVRHATARALNESLYRLERDPESQRLWMRLLDLDGDIVPAPVLLDGLLPILRTHAAPGCDASVAASPMVWAASSIVTNLFRLFPGRTLVLCDYLASEGVAPAVLHMVRRRLGRDAEAPLRNRMGYYLVFEHETPDATQLMRRLGTLDHPRLGVASGSPDGGFLGGAQRVENRIRRLLESYSLAEARKAARGRLQPSFQSLYRVDEWVNEVCEAIGSRDDAPVAHFLSALRPSADRLHEPYRSFAIAILEHLGELEGRERASEPRVLPNDGSYIDVVYPVPENVDVQHFFSLFEALQELTEAESSPLVHIAEVRREQGCVVATMEKLPERHLGHEPVWAERVMSQGLEARIRLALKLCHDLASQLSVLHEARMAHGNVVLRSIKPVGRHYRLVDFSRLSGAARPVGTGTHGRFRQDAIHEDLQMLLRWTLYIVQRVPREHAKYPNAAASSMKEELPEVYAPWVQWLMDAVDGRQAPSALLIRKRCEWALQVDRGFDLFLCHSSENKPQVRRLAAGLRGAGVSVWVDEEQLYAGGPLDAQIRQGLRDSECVLAWISRHWLDNDKGWVAGELARARRRIVVLDGVEQDDSELPIVTAGDLRLQLNDDGDLDAIIWQVYCGLKKESPGRSEEWSRLGRGLFAGTGTPAKPVSPRASPRFKPLPRDPMLPLGPAGCGPDLVALAEGTLRGEPVPAFAIGRYPITLEEWNRIAARSDGRLRVKSQPAHRARTPVHLVSYEEVLIFLKLLTAWSGQIYRLPSDREWEFACRAGSETPFHTGDTYTPPVVGARGPWRVGQGEPNAFGLHDFHGNVWEWIADLPSNGEPFRYCRGGCWASQAQGMTVDARTRLLPFDKNRKTGFRVARSISAEEAP